MKETKLKVAGMSCQHCVMAVKMELKKLPLDSYDVEIGLVDVKYDETKVQEKEIENAIREAGYQVVR